MITAKTVGWLAGSLGFLSVALGAFGAHALKERLSSDALSAFKTAVDYQFIHAVTLLALSLWMAQRPGPLLSLAACAFLTGIVFFSGSLYMLVASGVRVWGAITPVGGLSFLLGWALVVLAALRE
jgi:uncharacterized membrane protein YgdD (TMEM256/DUF423 family)